jgi:hypothetical protein
MAPAYRAVGAGGSGGVGAIPAQGELGAGLAPKLPMTALVQSFAASWPVSRMLDFVVVFALGFWFL